MLKFEMHQRVMSLTIITATVIINIVIIIITITAAVIIIVVAYNVTSQNFVTTMYSVASQYYLYYCISRSILSFIITPQYFYQYYWG